MLNLLSDSRLHSRRSGLLFGVGDAAAFIADRIADGEREYERMSAALN